MRQEVRHVAEPISERRMQVWPISQGVHLVNLHTFESISVLFDRIEQPDRFAGGDGDDEIGPGTDVVEHIGRGSRQ
jgi:hypothetical protein